MSVLIAALSTSRPAELVVLVEAARVHGQWRIRLVGTLAQVGSRRESQTLRDLHMSARLDVPGHARHSSVHLAGTDDGHGAAVRRDLLAGHLG
jgi:hypothetical protein